MQGLPATAGSLTIVEDPVNARLLWLGTATGVQVTVDGGKHWRRFGKGLPPVPVEGMALAFGARELVLATHGRGIWVASVGPLEEMSDTLLTEAAHLFHVPTAYQYRRSDTYPSFGSRPFLVPNPPKGAALAYYLREAQSEGLKLLITTPAGDSVKQLTGPAYAGLQRVTWDLTRDRPRPREKGGPTDLTDLKQVLPGSYVVHLTVGKIKLERPIVVQDWPTDQLGRVR